MAYVKHQWETLEKITADRLNHIEDGIEDAQNATAGAMEEVEDVKSSVSVIETAIGTAEEHETQVTVDVSPYVNNDHFWNSQEQTAVLSAYNGYRSYDNIPVQAGEKYSVYIFRKSSVKQHAVLITDSELTILESYGVGPGSGEGWETYTFTVPSGAAYMLLTTGIQNGEWLSPTVKQTIVATTLNSVPELIERVDDLEDADEDLDARIDDAEGDIDGITDDIADLTAAIGYSEGETEEQLDISSLKYEDHFWNSEASAAEQKAYSTYCLYNAISVTAGERYKIAIWQMTSAKQHPVLLTDDNLAIAKSYKQTEGGSGEKQAAFDFVIPTGVTKMLLTTRNDKIPTVTKYTTGSSLNSLPDLIGRVDRVLAGKTVAVIGDSISTNGNPGSGADANAVEITVTDDDVGVELSAYLTYYDVQAGLSLGGHTFTSSEIGTEVTFTPAAADVGKVIGRSLTYNPNSTTVWWEVMQKALGNTTIPVCWSGSSVTSHEGSDDDYKTSYAWHDAQIRKCGIRTPGTMTRNSPDMIIIYRGTNDFSHSPYTKLTAGYFDGASWQYPDNDTVTGGYGFLEGLALTVKKLRTAYPKAQIYLCTLNVFKRVSYSHFPTNNGTNSLPEYNDAIRRAADFFGCGLIDFAKDGITFENCYSEGYITDSETIPTHPSDKGHAVMGRKAIADIRAQYNAM